MDLKKSGYLIAARRKELGMTQKELADRLEVTDKAISRWETGKGFPDSSLLQPLAKELELSITEIVNGERTAPEAAAKQADDALLTAMNYCKRMGDPVLGVLLLICGTIFALAPLYVSGTPNILLWGISAVCYAWGVMQYWNRWPSARAVQLLAVVCLVAALILQAIPGSAVLIFAGPDYRSVSYYSCFHPILVGYANFMPFFSAVLNAVNVLMALVMLVWKKDSLRNKVYICTIVAAVFMLLPVLLSAEFVTLMGYFVVLLLFFSAMFQARANGAR